MPKPIISYFSFSILYLRNFLALSHLGGDTQVHEELKSEGFCSLNF
jgi:hypothetical protein